MSDDDEIVVKYKEIEERIARWVASVTPEYLMESIGDFEALTAEIAYPSDMIVTLIMMDGIEQTVQGAFIMGMLWQRYLDSEEGSALNDLLKDVNLG